MEINHHDCLLPWSWGWGARQGRQRRFCPLFLRSSQDRRDTGKHNLAWFDVSTTIWRYVISFYLFPFFPCPETITTCSLVSHLSVSEFHHNLICVCYRWISAIRCCDFLGDHWINQCTTCSTISWGVWTVADKWSISRDCVPFYRNRLGLKGLPPCDTAATAKGLHGCFESTGLYLSISAWILWSQLQQENGRWPKMPRNIYFLSCVVFFLILRKSTKLVKLAIFAFT